MTSLGLFFVGAVLFINGLSLVGRVDAGGAAPVNAFVGSLLVGVTAFIVVPVKDLGIAENRDVIVGSVGFLLFAFTYLWVALNNWTGHSGSGLGWYCLWAAGVATFLAVLNFARYDDPRFGMLWVMWAVLFTMFFVVLALELTRYTRATGWLTVMEAFVTTTVPGALLLTGEWENVSGGVAVGVGLATLVVFATLLVRSPRERPAVERERELGVPRAGAAA